MLKCERAKNGLSAMRAFCRRHGVRRGHRGSFDYHFEHGQLWISHSETGAVWSVSDGDGHSAESGYCFEMVTEPDDLSCLCSCGRAMFID